MELKSTQGHWSHHLRSFTSSENRRAVAEHSMRGWLRASNLDAQEVETVIKKIAACDFPGDVLTGELLDTLSGIVGIKDVAGQARLLTLLFDVSHTLQQFVHIQASSDLEPTSVRRQTIARLDKVADKFIDALNDVSPDVRSDIYERYSIAPLDDEAPARTTREVFDRDLNHLARLLDAIKKARAELKSEVGRPDNGALYPVCREMMNVYEAVSGETFTYERQLGTSGTGGTAAFMTSGAMFVAEAARAFCPQATVAQLSSVMRTLKQ